MCTRYVSPEAAAIERAWHIGRHTPWQGAEVFPQRPGAFIRAARDSSEPARELVIGQWGLVPWFAKSPKLTYSTCNARSEEMANKATFKDSWRHGRRCIIPAVSFDEPNWESGRNVWWRFRRADGEPWGLAGLWNTWVDRSTGELVESYTMLTVNADHHPLMRRMHKPDPKLPPDAQDKRSVIPVAFEDVDLWLHGRSEDVRSLLRLDGNQPFEAGPADLDSGR
ncbi:MAG: SOS response-associated peptidase [Piscinibacter sp.]|uniref:SOS response-associated peptidase n=1 Tax=Piscinibacter sp. TaxID=1903157 RepID=UPI003D111F17